MGHNCEGDLVEYCPQKMLDLLTSQYCVGWDLKDRDFFSYKRKD